MQKKVRRGAKSDSKSITTIAARQGPEKGGPIAVIIKKSSVFFLLFFAAIYFSDSRGFFNADNTNNHVQKKWDSYYDFAKRNVVDILLIGNSHLYTGINPENLSNALGCNAFILAAPGTSVVDHYFALEEAIKVVKPSLVVLETYGIKKTEQHKLKGSGLSDQFKSFSARRNLASKLVSTPSLFTLGNYPYAWSNTLRNHDFIFTNYDQIKTNISLSKRRKEKDNQLYLGRFARFFTGIEDSILHKYKKDGPPVNGVNYELNETGKEYVRRIINLCKVNHIELIFLTIPMFEEHVSNYEAWRDKLKGALGEYSSDSSWLDLQMAKGYEGFSAECFENTYASNQHLTYNGSLLATYKLVDFVRSKKVSLPGRCNDETWRMLFYNSDGFFENNTPASNDPHNIVFYHGQKNEFVEEVILSKQQKYFSIRMKVKPQNLDHYERLLSKKANMSLQIRNANGQFQNASIELLVDIYHSSKEKVNYLANIPPIEICKIINFEIKE